jgi:hypothetical protein
LWNWSLVGSGEARDLESALRYFRISVENGNSRTCQVLGWTAEYGIESGVDIAAVVRRCESSFNHSPEADNSGECFQMAADSGDAEAANSLGGCLERGEGVDKDIDGGIIEWPRPSHIPADFITSAAVRRNSAILLRAAKSDRPSAELSHPMGENRFGICLEHGILIIQTTSEILR